jgi:hypothetical protein
MELTRIFVEVPISVQTPPNIEANERGIRSFEGAIPLSLATFNKTGIKTATTGVLFINADKKATDSIVIIRAKVNPYLNNLVLISPKKSKAPVLFSAALIMNIAPTVIVAGLLKPAMASSGEIIPVASNATITTMAVRSTGIFSREKRITARTRIINTIPISRVIFQYKNSEEDFLGN